MARFWIKAASTVFRLKRTVCSSSFSTFLMVVLRPMSVKYGDSEG